MWSDRAVGRRSHACTALGHQLARELWVAARRRRRVRGRARRRRRPRRPGAALADVRRHSAAAGAAARGAHGHKQAPSSAPRRDQYVKVRWSGSGRRRVGTRRRRRRRSGATATRRAHQVHRRPEDRRARRAAGAAAVRALRPRRRRPRARRCMGCQAAARCKAHQAIHWQRHKHIATRPRREPARGAEGPCRLGEAAAAAVAPPADRARSARPTAARASPTGSCSPTAPTRWIT